MDEDPDAIDFQAGSPGGQRDVRGGGIGGRPNGAFRQRLALGIPKLVGLAFRQRPERIALGVPKRADGAFAVDGDGLIAGFVDVRHLAVHVHARADDAAHQHVVHLCILLHVDGDVIAVDGHIGRLRAAFEGDGAVGSVVRDLKAVQLYAALQRQVAGGIEDRKRAPSRVVSLRPGIVGGIEDVRKHRRLRVVTAIVGVILIPFVHAGDGDGRSLRVHHVPDDRLVVG